ncbi:MAG: sterol desaturase family protein [Smithellaceae bacterium]|nr:sterol desaturase family protein [Smithellaceae bacterium]
MGFFLIIFGIVAGAERRWPRRPQKTGRARRWGRNLAIVAGDTALLRLIFPLLPVGFAILCGQRGWGILNLFGVPYPVALLTGFLFLDLTIYGQHVLFHVLPLFWRMHRMHHSDLDIDVTTGFRFHPLEICCSMLIKLAAVGISGAPAIAVLLFEIALNATSMFNHGNIFLPLKLDHVLRLLTVTPDMHRVHHSAIVKETNSNYGFNLPWWDRIFGTYRPQPAAGHLGMTIGLSQYPEDESVTLSRMLAMPFVEPRR